MNETERIEILTDFLHKMILGLDTIKYKEKEIGMNIFILNYVGHEKEVIMTDIIQHMNLLPSTATRRVDKLVDLGLIDRYTPKDDRRIIKLKLTQEGEQVYKSVIDSRFKRFKLLEEAFSEKEINIFFKFLSYFNKLEMNHKIQE